MTDNYIPTEEEFLEKLFSLNKQGTPSLIYNYLKGVLMEERTTFNGTLITFDFIVSSYTKYINWWRNQYSGTEEKYLGKNKLKDISNFLINTMYENDFAMPVKKRDKYLFGTKSIKELNEDLSIFKSVINQNDNSQFVKET